MIGKFFNKLVKFVLSMAFTGILLLFLAVAMAVATFVESQHGAEASQGLIYQAWWFELAILLIFINLLYNIFRFKLYTWKRMPVFLFHAAFLVIILGGALTRFTGKEGTVHIRENSSANHYNSYDTYFYIKLTKGEKQLEKMQKVYLSPVTNKQVKMKFTFGDDRISIRSVDFVPGARMQAGMVAASGNHPDVLQLKISVNGGEEDMLVRGRPKAEFFANQYEFAGIQMVAAFGVKSIEMPFTIALDDFQLDRYPGSMSPSSFASEVRLIDEANQVNMSYRIFMNNILKYKGYRFYQSSFDQDEKGTVLSLNHDRLGTSVTYIGYFLMILFIILALFAPGSRFRRLVKETGKHAKVSLTVLLLVLMGAVSLHAQNQAFMPNKAEATEFGKVWVHGAEGRFKPVNTVAQEVIRKVIGDNNYQGYSPEQFWLSLMITPEYWEQVPFFKIDRDEIKQLIGKSSSKVAFRDFFDSNGGYVLSPLINASYSKKPSQRKGLDKKVLKLDEILNVFYMARTGQLLSIFPNPKDSHAKWFNVTDAPTGLSMEDSLLIVGLFPQYLDAIHQGKLDDAAGWRKGLQDYQQKIAVDVLPKQDKAGLEMLYNRLLIFERLAIFYALIGIIFLVVQFLSLYKPKKWQNPVGNVLTGLMAFGFVLHTLGLILRWFISGHAPMSNGYESMIFVAWGTVLAGLIVVRRSKMPLALTGILAALSLLVAHMSWMNPEITPLVPVLKSVWLTIHVAVIMTSYSFLGLGTLIGLMTMFIYLSKNQRNHKLMDDHIEHLTNLNKLVLMVGLYLITIGCFLGAIWANEAWGRYWGWDPKETWALITILVYSFIVHMNRIKGFEGNFSFNLGSLMGFSSVLMTYFGVNYFLGGMHSYASGETPQMPIIAYVVLIILVIVCYAAYFNQMRFEPKPEKTK